MTFEEYELCEIGDIVHLKSGSPKLTITGWTEDYKIDVSWISADGLKEATFPHQALNCASVSFKTLE